LYKTQVIDEPVNRLNARPELRLAGKAGRMQDYFTGLGRCARYRRKTIPVSVTSSLMKGASSTSAAW